jgi:hypothetical protein
VIFEVLDFLLLPFGCSQVELTRLPSMSTWAYAEQKFMSSSVVLTSSATAIEQFSCA